MRQFATDSLELKARYTADLGSADYAEGEAEMGGSVGRAAQLRLTVLG